MSAPSLWDRLKSARMPSSSTRLGHPSSSIANHGEMYWWNIAIPAVHAWLSISDAYRTTSVIGAAKLSDAQ